MLNLLVTGGAGFIGSHYVDYLLKNYPDYKIITLDKLTYAGSIENLANAQNNPQHTFVKGDILDTKLLSELFSHYEIDSVVHFAAESHVDNSIAKPDDFIQTNIVGTFQLLQTARQFWQNKKSRDDAQYRFHHISTDEVYGSLGETGYFKESSSYAPNSPYSASKASSDMLVRSYNKTYGLNTVITNCSNNFGPRQHDEKLIPTVIRHALQNKPIPIYGQGTNVRDWIFVDDHSAALDSVFHHGQVGEVYNIGGEHEVSNIKLAEQICAYLDKLSPTDKPYRDLIQLTQDRLGHDFRYAIKCDKLKMLGWQLKTTFNSGLEKTIEWYVERYRNT